jgi:CubicO group peptidase (beta-lactamase class C family)
MYLRYAHVALLIGALGAAGCRSTQLGRAIRWGSSDVNDYRRFAERRVESAPPVYHYAAAARQALPGSIEFSDRGQRQRAATLDLLTRNGTTSFLLIRDDLLVYEGYFNGTRRDSIQTSFSTAKSVGSTLVGLAIADGSIRSVDDPIVKYLPELERQDNAFGAITIRHLLEMRSGLRYKETWLPWGDPAKTYYDPNLRRRALASRIATPPGQRWLYNNYNPLLIGMILERATGRKVADYLQEKIWKPLGAEYSAGWSTDNEKDGFEKMDSGINARAVDFAKFGSMFLHGGKWNGRQIVPAEWVREATGLEGSIRVHDQIRYKYFWWIYPAADGHPPAFAAIGNLGQFILVSPEERTVIVRFGTNPGRFHSLQTWISILRAISTASAAQGLP